MNCLKIIARNLFLPPKNKNTPLEDVPQEDGSSMQDSLDIIDEPIDIIEEEIIEDELIISNPSNYHWIIDCGHGRLTKGKRSPVLPEGGQLLEYKYTGAIGLEVSRELDRLNIDHSLVPPNQEVVANHLKYSVDFANNYATSKPKIFISIHGNAGPVKNATTDWSTSFSGIEVWHFTPSLIGRKLAMVFQNSLVNKLQWRNRGIKSKKEKQFYVLRKTNMPSALLEIGFYNNLRECRLMIRPSVQKEIAEGVIDGIKRIENSKEI